MENRSKSSNVSMTEVPKERADKTGLRNAKE
jgi:hypothetical protein